MTLVGGTLRAPGMLGTARESRLTLAEAAAYAAVMALLIWPALWNGFPLLQYDTGGYFARWYEGYLVPSRSTVYGFFLYALQWADFWPAVLAQSAVTAWMFALVLRVYGFGARPGVLAGVTALLAATTSLPWLSAILLTDIFAGLGVLALHLIIRRSDAVTRGERVALTLLIGFAVASHSATFAVLLALLVAAGCVSLYDRAIIPRISLTRGASAIALGAAMLFAANFAMSGKVTWTPGGYGIVFARMMQDGIVKRFLDEHCQTPRFKLCPYRNDFPESADAFLWGQSVFNKLGRFAGLDAEMRTIVIESLRAYPLWQAKAALQATALQLIRVETGEGVINSVWHTYGIITRYAPAATTHMRGARQQHGELSFDMLNRLHVPVALGSALLLLLIIALGLRRRRYGDLGALATTAALAILANAAICAIISNPHARYGARLAWIATLVVILAALRVAAREDLPA